MATLTPELQRRVGHLWAARARFELDAEQHFRRLSRGLAEVGAPARLVDLAAKSAEDEARHSLLAGELAERFGARPPNRAHIPTSPAPAHLEARERVLYESVALCAVMESLSALLLRKMRSLAEDEQVRSTLHAILTDEITHSRIGWGHLVFEAKRGDIDFLAPYIPVMLAGTVHDEIFVTAEGDRGHELEPWGGLGRAQRRACFEEACGHLILPGLSLVGIDVTEGRAWFAARTTTAA
ncbi:MAG: hypothetical protein KC912_01275 [Proteobacteria bacterium]|nr:hypothetical protein [Pseudomonadota bacterium]